MRISDWSSDVCSSDLRQSGLAPLAALPRRALPLRALRRARLRPERLGGWRTCAGIVDRRPGVGGRRRRPAPPLHPPRHPDRKSVVVGKSGAVSVDLGGRGVLKKKTNNTNTNNTKTHN